jgi:glycerate kinase
VGFADELDSADAVLTGEGRLDAQSAQGKVLDGLGTLCRARGVPLHAIVGQSIAEQATIDALGLRSVIEASTVELIRESARRITVGLRG